MGWKQPTDRRQRVEVRWSVPNPLPSAALRSQSSLSHRVRPRTLVHWQPLHAATGATRRHRGAPTPTYGYSARRNAGSAGYSYTMHPSIRHPPSSAPGCAESDTSQLLVLARIVSCRLPSRVWLRDGAIPHDTTGRHADINGAPMVGVRSGSSVDLPPARLHPRARITGMLSGNRPAGATNHARIGSCRHRIGWLGCLLGTRVLPSPRICRSFWSRSRHAGLGGSTLRAAWVAWDSGRPHPGRCPAACGERSNDPGHGANGDPGPRTSKASHSHCPALALTPSPARIQAAPNDGTGPD